MLQPWDIDIDMLQPWSTPVMKTKLRSDVLQTMTELSDQVLADKNAVDWGPMLAGQIGSEPLIDHNILDDKTIDQIEFDKKKYQLRW